MINNALESSYILNKIALMWKKPNILFKMWTCWHYRSSLLWWDITYTNTHTYTHTQITWFKTEDKTLIFNDHTAFNILNIAEWLHVSGEFVVVYSWNLIETWPINLCVPPHLKLIFVIFFFTIHAGISQKPSPHKPIKTFQSKKYSLNELIWF